MTIDIAELRRLLAEATPPSWTSARGLIISGALLGQLDLFANARLVCALRNAAPDLLDRVEAADRRAGDVDRLFEVERLATVRLAQAEGALADARSVPIGDVEACIRALIRERDQARALLAQSQDYIEHQNGCPAIFSPPRTCACGLGAIAAATGLLLEEMLARRAEESAAQCD